MRNRTHQSSRIRNNSPAALVAAGLILILASAASARDQLLLPAPLLSSGLARFAEHLDLSEAQSHAWRRAHLDYQHAHREARTTYLDALQPLREKVRRIPFDVADPTTIRRYYALYQQAMEHLIRIDRELFDELAPLLTDSQRDLLPGLIAQRERDSWLAIEPIQRWWRSPGITYHGGGAIDPYAVLEQADLDRELRQHLFIELDHRTKQFAHALRELYRETAQLHRTWSRRLAELELDDGEEPSISDRALPYIELSDRALAAFDRALRIEHDAARALIESAPSEDAWQLFVSIVDTVGGFSFAPMVRRFDQILPSIRHAAHEDRRDNEIDGLIEACRQAMIEHFMTISEHDIALMTDHPPGIGHSMGQIQQAMMVRSDVESIQAAIDRLIDHVDEDLADALREVITPTHRQNDVHPPDRPLKQRLIEQFDGDLTPDDFIPGPISRETVTLFADAARLSPDQQQLLETLHMDYERSFMQLRRGKINDVVGIFIGFRITDDRGVASFSPMSDVQRKHEARLVARKAVEELDDGFMQDVENAVLGTDERDRIWLLRLLRAGNTQTCGTTLPLFTGGNFVAHRASLINVLLRVDLDDDERDAALEAVQPQVPALRQALRELYQGELALQHANHQHFAIVRETEDHDKRRASEQRRYRAMREARRIRQHVVAQHFIALDNIESALPASAAVLVRDQYYRAAFLAIYDDDEAQHERFQSAFALTTLTDSQRDRLIEAWLEYQTNYRDASWQMTALMRDAPHAGIIITQDDRDAIDRMEHRLGDLRLQRDQSNDHAMLAIETTLTRDQLAALRE